MQTHDCRRHWLTHVFPTDSIIQCQLLCCIMTQYAYNIYVLKRTRHEHRRIWFELCMQYTNMHTHTNIHNFGTRHQHQDVRLGIGHTQTRHRPSNARDLAGQFTELCVGLFVIFYDGILRPDTACYVRNIEEYEIVPSVSRFRIVFGIECECGRFHDAIAYLSA